MAPNESTFKGLSNGLRLLLLNLRFISNISFKNWIFFFIFIFFFLLSFLFFSPKAIVFKCSLDNVYEQFLLSRGHATLHLAVSVGPSVGRSVPPSIRPSVTFLNSDQFLQYCSCPTVRDWIAVYLALLLFMDTQYWVIHEQLKKPTPPTSFFLQFFFIFFFLIRNRSSNGF